MKSNSFLIISLFILLNVSNAATITSTTTGGNWSSTSTWVGGVLPTSSSDVVINGSVNYNGNYSAKTLTINSGKSFRFNVGAYTLSLAGSFSNQGDFYAEDGTVKFTNGNVSGTVSFNNVIIDGKTQFNFGGSATVNGRLSLINSGDMAYSNSNHPYYGPNAILDINGTYNPSTNPFLWVNDNSNLNKIAPNIVISGGIVTQSQGITYLKGTFTVNAGATFNGASGCLYLISGFQSITNNGTITLGGVTVQDGATWNVNNDYTLATLRIENGGIVNANNYTLILNRSINSCASISGIMQVVSGGMFNAGTSTIIFNISGNATFTGNIILNNLVVANGTVVTNNSGNSLTINGSLSVNSGANFQYGNSITTGTLTFGTEASITNNGGNISNITNPTTVPTAPTPTTVDNTLTALANSITGGGTITGGLSLTAPNSYSLTSNLTITGSKKVLYIYALAEFISNGYTITADSVYLMGKLDVKNSGGLAAFLGATKIVIANSSTVTYSATTGTQTITSGSYANLILSGAAQKTLSGTYNISGNFNVTGTTPSMTSNPVFTFNGANQSIKGLPFNNVTFSGSGNKTLTDSANIKGIVTLAGSANLISNGLLTLTSTVDGTSSIGPITGTAKITGNINYERFIPAGRLWRFIGWPLSGNTFANSWQNQIYLTGSGTGGSLGTTNSNGFDYTASSEPSLYYYNEASSATLNNKWTNVPNTSTAIDPTKGYRLFIRGNRNQGITTLNGSSYTPLAVTLKGTGIINTGDFPITLTCSNGCGTDDGWHLLANPYPSAIDWNNAAWVSARNTNIQSTLYVYNPTQNKYGAWSTIAGSVNGGTSNIASGQSFYIKTNGATSLTFKESYKVTNSTVGLFGKSSGLQNNLKIQIGDNTKVYDETIVFMYPSATFGIDQNIDATKPDVANASISTYTTSNSSKLIFNGIPEINNGDSAIILLHIPLANYTYAYNISFSGLSTFNNSTTQFLLIDNYTNSVSIVSDLSAIYSFNTIANVPSSYAANRFTLKITTSNGSLPVKLTSFSGAKNNGTTLLKWTTASEVNNDRFNIERSVDGLNYETIGSVLGSNNSSKTINYNYVDEHPINGINYYRLNQFDKDGVSTLSTVISLNFKIAEHKSIEAYPIPANNVINIALNNSQSTIVNITLTDMVGKTMYEEQIFADQTNYVLPIQLNNYKPGVYFIKTTSEDGVVDSIKFIKN